MCNNSNFKCQICNKQFDSYKKLSGHLSNHHHIKTKEYYDKYFKKDNEGICECGKESKFLTFSKGYDKKCLDCNNKKIICKICNKELRNWKSLNYHINYQHNLNNKDYYDHYIKKDNEDICIYCHNQKTSFISLSMGYHKYCSRKCIQNDLKINNKKKRTKKERYGNENYVNVEKIKQTKKERYNNENYNNKDKAKETLLNNYNVEYTFQSKEIQEKSKQTKMSRYGDENYNNRDKARETCLNKYGVDNYFKTEESRKKYKTFSKEKRIEIQKKREETNLKKYGIKFAQFTQKSKYKYRKTLIENFGSIKNYYRYLIKEIKQTKKERYNNENYNNPKSISNTWKNKSKDEIKEIKNKHKETNKERYGDENYYNKEKYCQTCLDRYGVNHTMKIPGAYNKIAYKIRKTKEMTGFWLKWEDINDFKKYSYLVWQETRKYIKTLYENWNGNCFYTGEKLITNEEFRKNNPGIHLNRNKLKPTIDHKISVFYGFKHGILPNIIGNINNLVICSKWFNSFKNSKTIYELNDYYINKLLGD